MGIGEGRKVICEEKGTDPYTTKCQKAFDKILYQI